MNQTSPPSLPARSLAKPLALAASLALAVGLAATAQAQYMPTNVIEFNEYSNSGAVLLTDTGTQPLAGMPDGITATWGWQFFGIGDWPSWGSAYAAPAGNQGGFDCRSGSGVTFSSPVIIWSIDYCNGYWTPGATVKVTGKLAGAVQWVFNWNASAPTYWVTVTNGAFYPIDELDFVNPDWGSRATHILISDASGAPAPPCPKIVSFGVTPDTQYRMVGSPVMLTWTVGANGCVPDSLTIDNGIGDVLNDGSTDQATGLGSISINPTNTTTYTLTWQQGTQTATQQVTVKGATLPTNVGFLTFEDLAGQATVPASYSWNMTAGVYPTWTGWGIAGGTVGFPSTPVDVFPLQWPLNSTNSLGETNNATLQFFQTDGVTPQPVMLNSFAVYLQQLSWATNPPPTGWGRCVVEGKLAGVVQWTWDEMAEGHDWENTITKGAGIQVDEVDFAGQFYQYDNFCISTNNLAATPVLQSPLAQSGNFQFSWNSVADWANYVVLGNNGLAANGWSRVGGQNSTPTGTTNTYSQSQSSSSGMPEFFRVLRVP
jgi:hypothetical protein